MTSTPFKPAISLSKLFGESSTTICLWSLRFSFANTVDICSPGAYYEAIAAPNSTPPVVNKSRCPLLLTRDLSALHHKVACRERSRGGIHKGAAALLWGEPAASTRASGFGWRAACLRRGGDPPAPAFPRRGNGKGEVRFLSPPAGPFTPPPP